MKITEEIKDRTDLVSFLEKWNVNLKASGKNYVALCPFHEEKNPSFTVYQETQTYFCFGCKRSGDIFSFLMEKENLSFSQSLDVLSEVAGIKGDGNNSHITLERTYEDILTMSSHFFYEQLLNSEDALEYLKGRGITENTIQEFKIGFAPEKYNLYKNLREKGFEPEQIYATGLIRKNKNSAHTNYFYNRIIFPHLRRGRAFYMAGREFNGKTNAKYLKLPTNTYIRSSFFNIDSLYKKTKTLILAEGYFDCILAVQYGFPAFSFGGTHINEKILEDLKGKSETIHIVFDSEISGEGERAALLAAEKLFARGINSQILILPKAESQEKVDLADFLLKEGKDAFNAIQSKGLGLIEYKIKKISLQSPQDYHALIRDRLLRHLIEIDDYDLAYYLDLIKKECKFDTQRISGLKSLVKSEKKRQVEFKQKTLPQNDNIVIPEMSKQEREEAIKFLKSKDMLEKIQDHLREVGIVGEETNALALYLITLTRKLEEPISAIIFAKSSVGKSYLINNVAKLIPPEDALVLSSATEQSLNYIDTNQIDHRVVIFQEIQGMKEIMELIRIIQSEGCLRRAFVYQDPITKKMRTDISSVDCKTSVISTTTWDRVHPENATRIFEIYPDESPTQTNRIIDLNKKKFTLDWYQGEEKRKNTIRLHHNIQRVLEPVKIVIPFAEEIEFSDESVRYRRDSKRVLMLISAVAFLRQYQKEEKFRENIRFIEADLKDYRIAHDIVNSILLSTISPVSERAIKILDVCKKIEYEEFTRRHIKKKADKLGIELPSYPTFKKALDSLVENNYLIILSGDQGKEYKYKIDPDVAEGKNPKSSQFIIDPDDLEKKLK